MLKNLKVIALLLSILGLTFACTLKESNETSEENPPVSSISVTLKITNAADFDGCDFIVAGKLNENYLFVSRTNSDQIQFTVSKGTLQLQVEAVKDGVIYGLASISSVSISKKLELEITLEKDLQSITITFDSNGGSAVQPQTVIKGLNIGTLPTPTKENFQFEGWYSDTALQQKVTSSTVFSADTTLYAKWVSSSESFTVKFDTDGGNSVADKTVKAGGTIDTSPITIKAGYVFSGWYTDKTFANVVSFPFIVTENCTLYAKWTSESEVIFVESITLDTTSLEIAQSETADIMASVLPANATDKTISWTSANSDIAVVTGGTVRGVSEGTTVITASVNGRNGKISAVCTVTVKPAGIPVESVTFAETSIELDVGSSKTLTANILPANASNKVLTYSSSNVSVATVDQSGKVTGVGGGTAVITATSHNAKTATCSVTVIKTEPSVGMPKLIAGSTVIENNGTCSDATTATDFTFERSSMLDIVYYTKDGSIPTTSSENQTPFKLKAGTYTIKAIATQASAKSDVYTANVTVTDPLSGKTIIFVKADSAPDIWAWEVGGVALSAKADGTWGTSSAATKMTDAKYMNDPTGWYMIDYSSVATGEKISFKLNWSDPEIESGKSGVFWYDGTSFYDEDPTTVTYSEPNITITPKDGKEIKSTGTISISIRDGNSPLTFVSASVGSKSYSLSDFSDGSLAVPVSTLGVSNDSVINVSVTATNNIGSKTETASLTVNDNAKVDKFSWDNALIYFVMTDRFYNGNTSNDTSYGRIKTDCKGKNIGTFHGGDIAGLTQKLDYLDDLGVNAIWISAPYEQIHGWVGGGNSGDFAHYGYHGYYVLDYTGIDKNMGTVEEFRTFVNAAHEKGIRVVMDIVMNHTGYENMKDMEEYGYGSLTSGANFSWLPSSGETFHQKPIDKSGSNWDKFWGSNWVRGDFNGYTTGGGDLQMCLDYLPDFKTESTSSEPAPAILKTKWAKETSGYDDWIIPAAKNLRKDLGLAPAVYIEKWLAAWVEEFGIDGFRCDTAKHIDAYRWKELKDVCKTALETWRNSSRATGDAKNWDEDFWMTGECFTWYIGNGYYYNYGFDSMIDFSYNSGSGSTPNVSDWASRADKLNGTPDDGQNALAYISSHDTSLYRPGDMITLGTNFLLLPGQVQIFYGDETGRSFGDTGSDKTQGTRSDFNWDAVDGNVNKHWKKVGKFRQGHPAVGGGQQTEIASNTYKRYYNGQAGEDTVVIYAGSSSSVTVSGAFADGKQVRNAYTGETATVSGGKASFSTASNPVLVELAE